MIKALMKIPDIMLVETSGYAWSLTVGRFDARFEARGELAGILLIKLNDISLPLALINQWQRQFSSGEYMNNLSLVVMNECWWLAQYIQDETSLASDVHLQSQLVECMYTLAHAANQVSAQSWS
ncbi:MAG: hypothetical protein ACRCZ6_17695 [Kluyvera sp.]|uniref:hypothetical protein n=1 Tax=Kluyvera sp. TaxID=1538228 RepID=UPI003F3B3AEE